MKKTKIFLAGLLAGISGLIAPQWSNASTAPCTLISNTATAAYSVGGVPQANVTSAATTFNVGVKVIVSVTNNDGGRVTVVPSITTKYALKFTITNNGNAVQDYNLTSEAAITGTVGPYLGNDDSFDGNTIALYDDTGGTPGSFDGTDAVITSLNDVAADGGQKVAYIVYSPTDLTAGNLETAVYNLVATSKWGDGSAITYGSGTPTVVQAGGSCNGATTVDVVAGDGDGTGSDGDKDGAHSDDGKYEVCSAIIGVSKSHLVIWDTINWNSAPKALPGAIVEYTVQIANTGGAACPAVLSTISDTLQTANLTLVPTFYDGALGTAAPTSSTGEAFVVSCSAACGARACEGAGYTFTSANDSDGIDFVSPTFTATMTDLLPNEGACTTPGSITGATDTVTIKFQATIN